MASSTASIEDLHADIIALVLHHMDGPTLAAAACTSPLLHRLSSDPGLWGGLSLSSFPSLSHPLLSSSVGSHRSLFFDAFPFPDLSASSAVKLSSPALQKPTDTEQASPPNPGSIISAVDLYHKGAPVLSRVVQTDASSAWFLTSPFRIDCLDRKDPEPYPTAQPTINPEDLTLSWIVIDTQTGRAVNLSSRRPVSVDRHWYTGDTLVRFAVVLGGYAVGVVVTCGEETGHVVEVSLGVEDMDGMSVNGRGSLGILKAAMEGKRRGVKMAEAEARDKYKEFLTRKKERLEMKTRREGILDLCCTGFGALMFLGFLMMLALR